MPNVVLERPKMSRPMWEALKAHVTRERQRKKQELEADAEVERQRKEREKQQKQDSMTLSETKEQIAKLDAHLAELKDEKHQLFLQLKKVLNEDETRRRQLMNKEAGEVFTYLPQQVGQGGPQMFLQPVQLTRLPQYKITPSIQQHNPQHNPHALLPQVAGIKRSRSPSPPPPNYKFGPFKPPPQAMHPYPHKSMGLQYFPAAVALPMASQQQQQPPPQSSQSGGTAYSTHHSSPQPPSALYTYSGSHSTRSPQISRDEREPPKTIQPGMYLHPTQQLPRGFVLHQTIDQHGQPSQHKFVDENQKYYPNPATHQLHGRPPPHMNLHPGLTLQTPQGVSGGITSGYPVRTMPSGSTYQTRPPSPHVVYAGQGGGPPRLAYAHSHGQAPMSAHGQSHPAITGGRNYNLPQGMN